MCLSNTTGRRSHLFLLFALALSILVSIGTQPLTARALEGAYKQEAARRILRTRSTTESTIFHAAHNRGNIQLAIANNGTFGTFGQSIPDPFSGEIIPSCEFPRNTDNVYLWVGAFWIGAVVGKDTLVSCGSEDFYETSEFWPEEPELGGEFEYSSIDKDSKLYNADRKAYSEEDIVCEYYDTTTNPSQVGQDPVDGRRHIPLGIKVTQRSMAWSYDYADDFILFDYKVQNIGHERLKKVYMGIWVDGDAFHISRYGAIGWTDDIVGFYPAHPAPEGCGFIDTVNIAYHGDNDGDPVPEDAPADWDFASARSIVGTRVVRTPLDSLEYSFNWWIIDYSDASRDFGPRKQGTLGNPIRLFDGRLGTPAGDRARYHIMSNPEFDYDLFYTAVDHTVDGWLPPPAQAEDFARGWDCRYLLSFGPFDIEPGQALPVTFAWVGGEEFHQMPTDFVKHWDPLNPDDYYNTLNFESLATNARWASWVYDNPGVDTDNNGYRGKFRVCAEDTIGMGDSAVIDSLWYEGDGVPDFRGAGPPPAPRLRVIPSVGKLTLRWNGFYSETTRDVFTRQIDFEGYRVYAARDERTASFTILRSYDRKNYRRFYWENISGGSGRWVQGNIPSSLEELREEFDNPEFDPLNHPYNNPFQFDTTFYYFEKQDHNQSDLTSPDGIRKAYPDAVNPGTDTSLWADEDLTDEHGDPLPKFYEYEYVFDNVLATVPYYVAVTAFDYGAPQSGLAPQETKPINNSIMEFPLNSVEAVEAEQLDVFVYPNPYRIDGDYAARGFENRYRNLAPERARRINFANLPSQCRISIYSLDGDLVRSWEHDYPEGGSASMHDSWDLVTRNTQAAVSGLYYWVVESEDRVQIGKLVIIK